MNVLLNIVLPFFAIIGLGYLCRLKGPFTEAATGGLNNFVYWVAMPAMLFRAMSTVDPVVLLNIDFVLAYGFSTALVMVLGWLSCIFLFKTRRDEAVMNGMNVAYGNAGFLGIPLAFTAFGETAAAPIILTVITSALVAGISVTLIELLRNKDAHMAAIIRHSLWVMMKNPLIFAPVLGVAFAATDAEMPEFIARLIGMLGDAASPCALFALGMFLVGKPITDAIAEVSAACILKLLVLPLVCWLVIVSVTDIPPLWQGVAMVMAATPTGVGSFVVAKQYGLYEKRTSSTILLSTVVSIPVLFLLLHYYLPYSGVS